MALSTTDLLELRGIRRRQDRYRFDLLDSSLAKVGEVRPVRRAVGISLDTTSGIMRTASQFHLDANEQADIDTVTARVRPVMVLQNGDESELGVFMFGDTPRARRSWGFEVDALLVDLSFILDQPVGRVVGFPVGANIVDSAQAIAQEVIATPMLVISAAAVLASPLAWRPSDTRLRIIDDLLASAGYLRAHFDNSGTLVMRPVRALPLSYADLSYLAGGRVHKDSMVDADDQLVAPNRWVVIDTSNTTSPVVGSYDLPPSAPNSEPRRGFYITQVIERQGVGSSDMADAAARAAADSDPSGFKEVTFDSTHDPRHDAFNVLDVYGEQYLETRWSVTLRSGGTMSHRARRVYE